MLPTRVLLPLRGPTDGRACLLAADTAMRFGVELHLFTAVTDQHEVAAQQEYLDEVAARVRERHEGLKATASVVVDPHAPEAIAAASDDHTLPVMATSARPFVHQGYLGSAAEHVIRATNRPVLLCGPRVDPSRGLQVRRIMVPVDGSSLSLDALPVAQAWAQRLSLPIWVFSVVDSKATAGDTVEGGAAPVRELAAGVGGRWEVLHASRPADALASAAGSDSLVIMTTHGRSGIRRIAMGSVASDLARHTQCPVVVVAPT